MEVLKHHLKEATTGEVKTIGLDVTKSIFQAHGALHVAPPFELLAGMLTIRIHLDATPGYLIEGGKPDPLFLAILFERLLTDPRLLPQLDRRGRSDYAVPFVFDPASSAARKASE